MRLALHPELLIRLLDAEHVELILPGEHRRVVTNNAVIEFIHALAAGKDGPGELAEKYDPRSVRRAIDGLRRARILIPADETETAGNLARAWTDWGTTTWAFHASGKDIRYITDSAEQLATARRIAQTAPPPDGPACSCGDENSLELPAPSTVLDCDVAAAMVMRRTRRNFSSEPLTLNDISTVLFYSAAVLFTHDTSFFGRVSKKCAPSPGARHSVELYPLICLDGDASLYHYCSRHHALNRGRVIDDYAGFLSTALYEQPYFHTPLVIFFTSVPRRLLWKYTSARTYRLLWIEAGHYCQNLLLTSTALGLGAWSSAAIADSYVEEAIRVDPTEEMVTYAAGVGRIPGGQAPYRRRGVEVARHVPLDAPVQLPETALG